jgi:hypothetical protein
MLLCDGMNARVREEKRVRVRVWNAAKKYSKEKQCYITEKMIKIHSSGPLKLLKLALNAFLFEQNENKN